VKTNAARLRVTVREPIALERLRVMGFLHCLSIWEALSATAATSFAMSDLHSMEKGRYPGVAGTWETPLLRRHCSVELGYTA